MCTNPRKCVNKIPHFGKKPTDFLAKTRDLRLYSNGAPSPVGLWFDYMSDYMEQLIGFDSLYEGSHHLLARLREQVDDRYLGQGVASRGQSEGGAGHPD